MKFILNKFCKYLVASLRLEPQMAGERCSLTAIAPLSFIGVYMQLVDALRDFEQGRSISSNDSGHKAQLQTIIIGRYAAGSNNGSLFNLTGQSNRIISFSNALCFYRTKRMQNMCSYCSSRQVSKIHPNAVIGVLHTVLLASNMNSKHSRLFNSLNVKKGADNWNPEAFYTPLLHSVQEMPRCMVLSCGSILMQPPFKLVGRFRDSFANHSKLNDGIRLLFSFDDW
uniref:Uncharacterized protein n=1 Tax=Glossina austeni TaxID=7395 RepID=A0A1A9UMU9_GLOAU